jgi:hypothetical protein
MPFLISFLKVWGADLLIFVVGGLVWWVISATRLALASRRRV